MPYPEKTWVASVLFWFAVLGAIKSFLWEWLVAPLLQRPKVVGTLQAIWVIPRGVTVNPDKAVDQASAFDTEIRMKINVFNKRAQPTYLTGWLLEVHFKRKSVAALYVDEKSLESRRSKIDGPLMLESIKLEKEEPHSGEIARNSVESQRLSTLIDYATAAPFAIGFLETALAIEDSSNGIWRWPITLRNCRSATSKPEPTHRSI